MAAETAPPPSRQRVQSVDVLRGLVMIIMAIDHVRDFFHYDSQHFSPEDLSKTTVILFLTRWFTHFCAPVFVFLAGTSAYLSGRRGRSTGSVSRLLITRGLWLILVELTIVKVGMTFNVTYDFVLLQVIWALGWSMIALAALIHLPLSALVVIGGVMIVGHNLLDGIEPGQFGSASWVWIVLHVMSPVPLDEQHLVLVAYPLIPWIGVMALGYGFGRIYELEPVKRRQRLWQLGLAVTLAFVLVRGINVYGDPRPWTAQPTPVFTVLSFLSATKYPPSLVYLLMTLGPALLILASLDSRSFGSRNPLLVFGKVPFFYYVGHWYTLHLIALVFALVRYGRIDFIFGWPPSAIGEGSAYPGDWGWSLGVTYVVWVGVVAALYPACAWFAGVKARNKSAVLSYL